MQNSESYKYGYSIYPGEYVPLLNKEEIKEELKQSHQGETVQPPVNLTELNNSFTLEIAIPGVKREEFLIYIDENILSVGVLHERCRGHKSESFHLHEFNYSCFDRHINLPANVDSQFVRAEYAAGILHLDMPKTRQPEKKDHIPVVVY